MGYESAWLSYKENHTLKIPWNGSKIYADTWGKTIEAAVTELQRAVKEICGMDMGITGQEEEAGILLKREQDNALGEEGYKIQCRDGRTDCDFPRGKGTALRQLRLYPYAADPRRVFSGRKNREAFRSPPNVESLGQHGRFH